MSETLGRAVLEILTDAKDFLKGLAAAESTTRKSMADIGKSMATTGAVMSAAITAPLALFGQASLTAFRDASEGAAQMRAALESMGPVAGRTEQQLTDMAQTMQRTLAVDADEVIRKVTTNLLTFGNISGEAFDRAQLAAVNLSARLGTDLQGSAVMVGKALNDPIRGVTALQRVGVSFTEQQREQITAMVEAGNVAGAQAMILAELERQYGGQAKALAEASLGTRQVALAWGDFQERVGEVISRVLPPLMAKLSGVLDWLNNLDAGTLTWIVTIGAIAAALGPALVALGMMVTGLASAIGAVGSIVTTMGTLIAVLAKVGKAIMVLLVATGPIGLMIAAAAALTAAWLLWGDEITAIVGRVADAIRIAFTAMRDFVEPTFAAIADTVTRTFAAMIAPVQAAARAINAVFAPVRDFVASAFAAMADAITQRFAFVITPIQTAAAAIRSAFTVVRDFVLGAFTAMIDAVKRAFGFVIEIAQRVGRALGIASAQAAEQTQAVTQQAVAQTQVVTREATAQTQVVAREAAAQTRAVAQQAAARRQAVVQEAAAQRQEMARQVREAEQLEAAHFREAQALAAARTREAQQQAAAQAREAQREAAAQRQEMARQVREAERLEAAHFREAQQQAAAQARELQVRGGREHAASMTSTWATILTEFDHFSSGMLGRVHNWVRQGLHLISTLQRAMRLLESLGQVLGGGGGGGGLGGILSGIGSIFGGGGGIGAMLAAVPGWGWAAAGVGAILGIGSSRRRRRQQQAAQAAAQAAIAQAQAEQRAADEEHQRQMEALRAMQAMPDPPPTLGLGVADYQPARPEAEVPVRTLTVSGIRPEDLWTGKMVRALAEKLIDFQNHGGRIVLEH